MPPGHTNLGTVSGMASNPELRVTRTERYYRTRWRYGGTSGAPFEQAKFVVVDDTPEADRAAHKLCLAAKALAESKSHRIHEAEMYELVLGANAPARGVPTLRQFIENEWTEQRRPRNPTDPGEGEIQQDTFDDYVRILNTHVLPKIGHYLLTELDEDRLKEWVGWLRKQRVNRSKANPDGSPISARMVHRAHSTLHGVLGLAVGRHIDKNPAAKPPGSRKSRLGLPKLKSYVGLGLEQWERDAIRVHCGDLMGDVWDIACDTGLRLGEILVLRKMDVVVGGNDPGIWVRRALKRDQVIGEPKSEKSRRFVGVSTKTARILARRCDGKRPTDLLLTSSRGKLCHERNLNRRHWRPAVAAAMRCPKHPPPAPPKPKSGPTRKLRDDEVSMCGCAGVLQRWARIHDGRHTHAVDCIKAGWLPTEVQHRLGHASVNFTMTVYVHAWPSKYKERLDQMDRDRTKRGRKGRSAGAKRPKASPVPSAHDVAQMARLDEAA